MKHTVVGIFQDSNRAGKAVGELKEMGYTKDISILAQDVNKEGSRSHQIKQDLSDEAAEGAGAGAVVGGVSGALIGLLSGAAAFTVPGAGIAIVGPLATTLIGAGAGGGAGALVGALVDMGIPNERAEAYKHLIDSGEVLVTATVDPSDVEKVEDTMTFHQDIQTRQHQDYGDFAVYHYQVQ